MKKYVNIYGLGNEKRDFLYITDLLSFFDSLIKNQKSSFKIYNCCYGKSFKVKYILNKLINFSKKNKTIKYIKNAQNLNVDILVSNKKAFKELGWKPRTSLDLGLRKTLNWFIKNEKFL